MPVRPAFKHALLIINPTSGKMKAKNSLFEILDTLSACKVTPSVIITQKPLDARTAARVLGGKYPRIICCGGDGTLNEVISGVVEGGHNTPICYSPGGTTNDFATSLQIPKEIPAAVANTLYGTPQAQDIGLFGKDRYFTYIASFGILTGASYTATQPMKNNLGYLAYVIEGAKSLTDIKSYRITYEANGIQKTGDYIFGAVSNSNSIGGIFKFAPDQVDLHDGEYEAAFIRYPASFEELTRILHCIRTQNYAPELFDIFKTSRITLQSETPVAWTTDGEFAGELSKVTIQNIRDAARIVLPKA